MLDRLIDAAQICTDLELTAVKQEASELWAIFNRSQLTAKAQVASPPPGSRASTPKSVNS